MFVICLSLKVTFNIFLVRLSWVGLDCVGLDSPKYITVSRRHVYRGLLADDVVRQSPNHWVPSVRLLLFCSREKTLCSTSPQPKMAQCDANLTLQPALLNITMKKCHKIHFSKHYPVLFRQH